MFYSLFSHVYVFLVYLWYILFPRRTILDYAVHASFVENAIIHTITAGNVPHHLVSTHFSTVQSLMSIITRIIQFLTINKIDFEYREYDCSFSGNFKSGDKQTDFHINIYNKNGKLIVEMQKLDRNSYSFLFIKLYEKIKAVLVSTTIRNEDMVFAHDKKNQDDVSYNEYSFESITSGKINNF